MIFNMFSFFCLKIIFTFTNSVDPDEMQHYAAFHLGLHCLQKYSFRGFPQKKGLNLTDQIWHIVARLLLQIVSLL